VQQGAHFKALLCSLLRPGMDELGKAVAIAGIQPARRQAQHHPGGVPPGLGRHPA